MKKNILIIDDSTLMRRVLSDIINSDDRFTVSDFAVNGLEGIDLIVRNPNKYAAVLLDINMPKMNGIEVLEQLEKYHIRLTVILVSTVAKRDAKETIRALELGAFDFVTKPENFLKMKGDNFKNQLLQCLSVATNQILTSEDSEAEYIKPASKAKREVILNKSDASKLIALACSTGGPKALQAVIPRLPVNMDAAMLVVQHMPEGFTKTLAGRLNELSKVTVKEAEDGDIIQKGIVYIAKGGHQMRLVRQISGESKLSITLEPSRYGLRPCADIMYESLIDSAFDEVTCVVLTGMGSDGTKGIKQLDQKKRIYVIAQNEATSTVYGMPKVIKEAGLADEVLPLNEVADAIIRNVGVH